MDNSLNFDGQVALVVGGSSGIGNGIAHGFRARGATVHVWGTRAQATDYRAEEGCKLEGLHYRQVDASDPDAVAAAAKTFDRLDVLVLSQGIVEYGRAEFEYATFRRVVDLNLNSLMSCAGSFHAALKAAQGALIIVSSLSGYKAQIGNPAYGASKAGAISLTRSLGAAWAPDGIRVNGIAPGLVDTKLVKVTTQHPKRLDGVLQRIRLGRIGTPEDMANVALFLASPLAGYVVGHTIPVDGGLAA